MSTATGSSIGTVINKHIDTSPQPASELGRFNTTMEEFYSLLKAAQHKPNSKPRKWLAKRQKQRALNTYGKEGVGQHPRTGETMYKTAAAPRDGMEWSRAGAIKKADGYVRTIYDLIDLNYNFLPAAMGKGAGVSKADDPILSTTTGVHNDIYGSDVFALLNSEQNLWGILETRPWTKSGERIITEFAEGGQSVSGTGGVAENASLPDTTKPTFGTFETDPRTIVHTFDVSQVEQLLAATDDDAISDDPFALLRQWFGAGLPDQQQGGGEHPKQMNAMLGADADGGVASNDLLTLDAIISNSAESSIYTNADDNNVYGFDRSAGEFESNVIENGGSNQTFHTDLMDDALREVKQNSDKNPQKNPQDYVWVTGHDTYQRIENEFTGKERLEPMRVTTSVNGIQTNPGDDVGITVQSYKDVPIIETVDVPQDGLSRMYLVDKSTIWIKTLLPTQFYSTGTEVGDGPFPLGRLGNEGAFVTIAQTTCKNPVNHCKIRDIA